MRLAHIALAAAALFTVACAAPDEAADWNADVATHEAPLESRSLRSDEAERPGAIEEQAEEAVFADDILLVEDVTTDEVQGKRVPTRIEISRDHIHVEWSDGSESDYCYNQETGQYQAC